MTTCIAISLGSWLLDKISNKGFDILAAKLKSNNTLSTKFNKVVRLVCKTMEKRYPGILGDSLSYFFSNEVIFLELFKLLFKKAEVNLQTIGNNFDLVHLPKQFVIEFIEELKKELQKDIEFDKIFADNELFVSFLGLASDVNEIVHFTKLTKDELLQIRKLLEKQYKLNFNFSDFINVYYKNVLNNLSQLNFIGLGLDSSIKKGRKKLQDIFIQPNFKLLDKGYAQANDNILKRGKMLKRGGGTFVPLKQLFDFNSNLIILGKPGAGKSLLIKFIMCSIIDKKKIFSNRNIVDFVPFRIELRKYLAYKKENRNSLIKYIVNSIEIEFGYSGLTKDALEIILNTKKVLVFFDGLDEIFDVNDKIEIKNDIENFHNTYEGIRSIVTSRIIGYEEAQLNERLFTELEILDFDEYQIKEYVENWYKQEEADCEIRKREVNEFLSKKIQLDGELVSNPLLLSLIVILYRNNLKIPDSKLEIYQCCTKTLVDKWDSIKNLDIQLNSSILQKKESVFADLAFWQYELLSSKETVITYNNVKDSVAKFLIKKKLADEDNCDILAEAFLIYAQKRSIYFENNFTHKTFLEYYTAFWIYSNIEKKHDVNGRNNLINRYITNSFWYVVLELLLNMIDKDQPDSEIMDEIFERYFENEHTFPFLLYILPSLKNISNDVVIKTYQFTS